MLAKHVAQVFYVSDTTNKRLKVVIPKNDKSSQSRMSSMRKSLIIFDEDIPFMGTTTSSWSDTKTYFKYGKHIRMFFLQ
jgi:hypothetical protein